MPDATHTTLREQVKAAILPGLNGGRGPSGTPEQGAEALTNAVMGVVAERERLLRERIEALPTYRHQADGPCVERDAALAVFDA